MVFYRWLALVLGTIALLLTGWACGERVSDTAALHGAQPVSGAEIWRPPPTDPPKTPVQRPVGTVLAVLVPDPATTTTTTTTTSTTTTLAPTTTTTLPPTTTILVRTIEELVDQFFDESDYDWAMTVAFCESSAQPGDTTSKAVHTRSGASGWFQHLPKFWQERSEAAGYAGVDILDPEANVGVASWLLYEGGGKSHWNESKACWG